MTFFGDLESDSRDLLGCSERVQDIKKEKWFFRFDYLPVKSPSSIG